MRHVYGISHQELDEELPEWEADLLARHAHLFIPATE